MNEFPEAVRAARQFAIEGRLTSIAPHGSGHIHDTYRADFLQPKGQFRCILQRINRNIFKNPVAVMENIQRVTGHLAAQLAGELDRERRTLTLIPTHDGQAWKVDEDGEYWRAYRFIDRARTYDQVATPAQAFETARAFGQFQRQLAGLPPSQLHVTIPDFHHTLKRWQALERAVAADSAGRALAAAPEIDFALKREAIAGLLLGADLPERVTHNDTKCNNAMLDEQTGEGVCVIDLDTVMPGLAPYDFGDLVRTTTSPAAEDEPDLAKVTLRFPFFEAIARGYLDGAGGFLCAGEKRLLVSSGKVIAFEQGLRFLTDHLAGDTYYKVHRLGQNLDRCRTQFRLVESIERQEERMERLVQSLAV